MENDEWKMNSHVLGDTVPEGFTTGVSEPLASSTTQFSTLPLEIKESIDELPGKFGRMISIPDPEHGYLEEICE